MDRLKRWLRREPLPPSATVKAPVKVTVTARKVLADGTLGEEIELKNLHIEQIEKEGP